MAGAERVKGKREMFVRGLRQSGALYLLSHLPARDSLLVLNYHRVGNSESDPWDPGLFSATADELNDQISYLKRNHSFVTLEEALAFVDGNDKGRGRRCRVLITFDDGYLDNYEIAFPILRSQGVQGLFFLCTGLVGSSNIPWWDEIAYLVKNAQRRQFSLRYPASLDVDIHKNGLNESLRRILNLYKMPANTDPEHFMRDLKEGTGSINLPAPSRRFLNWDEARDMVNGKMAIGAHTHTHAMLSKLDENEQREELVQSRALLGEKLGIKADTMAYPFGALTAFTERTQQIAQEAGYRAAFSYYGAMANQQGTINRYDVKRVAIGSQSFDRFKAQSEFGRLTAKFWP